MEIQFFFFHEEDSGEGKSLVFSVPCTTIDLEIKALSSKGMLWLDVEGVPHVVLEGATATLKNIAIAQIEVEMHKMSNFRTGSLTQVHKIMRSSNFKLYRAPIHTGFFGDVIYIRKEELSNFEKFQSSILTLSMYLLRKVIYPSLKKPKKV